MNSILTISMPKLVMSELGLKRLIRIWENKLECFKKFKVKGQIRNYLASNSKSGSHGAIQSGKK